MPFAELSLTTSTSLINVHLTTDVMIADFDRKNAIIAIMIMRHDHNNFCIPGLKELPNLLNKLTVEERSRIFHLIDKLTNKTMSYTDVLSDIQRNLH